MNRFKCLKPAYLQTVLGKIYDVFEDFINHYNALISFKAAVRPCLSTLTQLEAIVRFLPSSVSVPHTELPAAPDWDRNPEVYNLCRPHVPL